MTSEALLAELTRRGAKVWIVDGRLRVRPRRAVLDLEPELRARANELAKAIRAGPPADWRNELDGWAPEKHARWTARAAMLETFEGLSAEAADRRAFDELRTEPRRGVGPWIVASDSPGPFRLWTAEEPPALERADLFETAFADALAAVELMNRRMLAGDDPGCALAARKLEEAIARLRREGTEAWLAS